jgi:hypothetical protein
VATILQDGAVEQLGVDRARNDVLAIGPQTRLLGTASCGDLKIITDFGEAEIPFEKVAALIGARFGSGRVSRLLLRDGQALSGVVTASDLRFVMPSGAKLNLEMENLDRLVRGKKDGEGEWAEGISAVLETVKGDRISLMGSDDIAFHGATPWGAIRFTLDDILWIAPPEDEAIGYQIEFKDGSRFFAFLAGDEVNIRTSLFGDRKMHPREIRAIVTDAARIRAREKDRAQMLPAPAQPHVALAGGQKVIGRINGEVIRVIAGAELIELPPDTIRLMRALDGYDGGPSLEGPEFQIELWGGGSIVGNIKDSLIPIQVRQELWQVPIGDIVELVSPQPRIPDAARLEISRLIRELGNEKWEKREEATEQLAEYGFMAKSLLNDAFIATTDAEVRRRIEKLLNSLE